VDVSAKAPSTVRRMGNQIEVRREISAPADTVYRFVSDVTRMGEWSPETTGCGWINGADGPAVGARFKGTNKHGSKTWSTVCTVVAADPDQSTRMLADEIGMWGKVVKSSGAKVE